MSGVSEQARVPSQDPNPVPVDVDESSGDLRPFRQALDTERARDKAVVTATMAICYQDETQIK